MEVEYAEVGLTHADLLDQVLKLYSEAFSGRPCVALPSSDFMAYLREFLQKTDFVPHLGVFLTNGQKHVVVVHVFATYREGAIGWYLITAPEARGQGLAKRMLKATIDAVRRDVNSRGWKTKLYYAELEYPCSPCWWEKMGYTPLTQVRYAQPPVRCGWQEGFRLGVIPLWCPQEISGDDVLSFVKTIYSEEYKIPNLDEEVHFQRVREDCEKMTPIELENCPY